MGEGGPLPPEQAPAPARTAALPWRHAARTHPPAACPPPRGAKQSPGPAAPALLPRSDRAANQKPPTARAGAADWRRRPGCYRAALARPPPSPRRQRPPASRETPPRGRPGACGRAGAGGARAGARAVAVNGGRWKGWFLTMVLLGGFRNNQASLTHSSAPTGALCPGGHQVPHTHPAMSLAGTASPCLRPALGRSPAGGLGRLTGTRLWASLCHRPSPRTEEGHSEPLKKAVAGRERKSCYLLRLEDGPFSSLSKSSKACVHREKARYLPSSKIHHHVHSSLFKLLPFSPSPKSYPSKHHFHPLLHHRLFPKPPIQLLPPTLPFFHLSRLGLLLPERNCFHRLQAGRSVERRERDTGLCSPGYET